MSTFTPRPVRPVALAAVTAEVEAAVAAWRVARAAREGAWAEYEKLSEAHSRKVRLTSLPSGRKPRRSQEFVRAERSLDRFEFLVGRAEAEIEMRLRVANPGADNASIMATKRELTRSAT